MNGRQAFVYSFHKGFKKGHLWIDVRSHLPVKIVMTADRPEDNLTFTSTCFDFQWDVPLDDSLFVMQVPDGYKLEPEADLSSPTEEDLVEMMRIVALLSDGRFPDEFVFVRNESLGGEDSLNPDHVITAGLAEVLLPAAGTLKPKSSTKLDFLPLLRTGTHAGTNTFRDFQNSITVLFTR